MVGGCCLHVLHLTCVYRQPASITSHLSQASEPKTEEVMMIYLTILHAHSLIYSLIGLSIERPILDHDAKAHIHEIRRIS